MSRSWLEAAAQRARAGHLTDRLLDALAGSAELLADPSGLGRCVDPASLLGDDGLPDTAKVKAATEQLVTDRPHLRSRRPAGGDVGQGGGSASPVADLAAILRANAG